MVNGVGLFRQIRGEPEQASDEGTPSGSMAELLLTGHQYRWGRTVHPIV